MQLLSSSSHRGCLRSAAGPAPRPSSLQALAGARSQRASLVCQAQQSENFFDGVKKVAKKVQGALPIIGLISRLTSDEGGFDELAYPDFTRSIINRSSDQFRVAVSDFEKKHGKVAGSRWILLLLWMVSTGSTLVPAKDVINAAKRMRITQDIEIEIDRFSATRANAMKKYELMSPPEGKIQDKLNLGVDAICTLCIGLKEGEPVSDEDASLMVPMLQGVFPEATPSLISASIAARSQRTYA